MVSPITLLLLYGYGLKGYAIAQSIVEASSLFITYIFIICYNKYLYKKENKKYKGIFMFEDINVISCDFSITNEIEIY